MLSRAPYSSTRRVVTRYDLKGCSFDYLELISGVPFHRPWPNAARLILAPGSEPMSEFLFNPLGWSIMSERLVDVVKPLLEKSEMLPAPVFESDGTSEVGGYWVVNVLNICDCVDWKRSGVSRDEHGRISYLNEPHLDSSLIPFSTHIFRVIDPQGHVDSRLFVSDELVALLKGKNFGMAFVPAS